MKKIILLTLALMSFQVNADPFKDTMKQMGEQFKVIAVELKQGAYSEKSVQAANSLVGLCQTDLKQTSNDIQQMFPDFKDNLSLMCTKLSAFSTLLQNKSEINSVVAAFKDIDALRRASHDKYQQQ